MRYRLRQLEKVDLKTRSLINQRLREFSSIKNAGNTKFDFRPFIDFKLNSDTLREFFFCILAANYPAKKACEIQQSISKNEWLGLTRRQLLYRLLRLGYRFPAVRSEFISESKKKIGLLKEILSSGTKLTNKRALLIKNFKGMGFKTSSHFLRNTGEFGLPIIDRQVLKFLFINKFTEKFNTLTEKRYKQLETILLKIADANGMQPGELDLYIFYLQTGTVLK